MDKFSKLTNKGHQYYGTVQSKNQALRMLQRSEYRTRNGSPGRNSSEQYGLRQQLAIRRRCLHAGIRHFVEES